MPLTTREIRNRLQAFAANPAHQQMTREEADEKLYTAAFMRCFGIEKHQYTREKKITLLDGKTGYIDAFIPGTLLIEAKSAGKNLDKAREQAENYRVAILPAEQPRYILLHDFRHFVLLNLEDDHEHCFTLAELPAQVKHFAFLYQETAPVIQEEDPVNREAAYLISRLHAGLLENNYRGHALETFLTRLLFCYFADDTLIFKENGHIQRWLTASSEDGDDLGSRLERLFTVLNTPDGARQKNLNEDLAQFDYVNGGLFAETIPFPDFDSTLRGLLLRCAALDWSTISPAIFGAMFQGILEKQDAQSARKQSRRELGAHYTSEKNILKVINALYMDGLRERLKNTRKHADLLALHEHIAHLRFLDPACGCGNFLVIAYRELRRLEHDLIDKLYGDNLRRNFGAIATYLKVNISQFYGIEIEEHACEIAKTALYITDHQMNREAAHRFGTARATIPLSFTPHIHCQNALRHDWVQILPPADCHYIIGNPPFSGKNNQNTQKDDMQTIAGQYKNGGILDYVAAWYLKAADYMTENPCIHTAFVSTNSITQGEQVAALWKPLLARGIHIHFAHRTFQWKNEGKDNAAVHCIIIGFAYSAAVAPVLYHYPDIRGEAQPQPAHHINPYLIDAENVIVEKRSTQISGEPKMDYGSMPNDGTKKTKGNGLILSDKAKNKLITDEPSAQIYIRRYLGAEEFLNDIPRWCLWFDGCDLVKLERDLKTLPQTAQRIANVKRVRQESKREATNKLATKPHLFGEIRQPTSINYLVIPRVSSENRIYIPVDFLKSDTINGDANFSLPDATLYHFGILSSTMHNAFMRTVSGRLKSDYRYSNELVYNNYPFPYTAAERRAALPDSAIAKAVAKIEAAAKKVLDARQHYRDAAHASGDTPPTLAQLYNHYLVNPYPKLTKAHAALDKAVDVAYGYLHKNSDDAARVAFLFDRFKALT